MDIIQTFKKWFYLKIGLYHKKNILFFKQRELWWCSLGINIGEEIFGKGEKFTRPVIIFKKFTSNSFLGIPLTSQARKGSWYVEIKHKGRKSRVMLNQARALDKKRLTKRIGTLDDVDFQKVQKQFLELYSSSQKKSSRQ